MNTAKEKIISIDLMMQDIINLDYPINIDAIVLNT